MKRELRESFFESENFKDLQNQMSDIHGSLDKVQIKKALEQIMHLGQTANTFFSDLAPWAQIKEDKELCAKTIAHSSIYAITLGCLFRPYLPKLSEGILSYFDGLTGEIISQTYQGNFEALKVYLKDGARVNSKPEGLVPKVDKERIKELAMELKS